MKDRLISSAVGLVLLAIVLFFYQTYAFNAAVAVVSAMGVYEILHSTNYVKSMTLKVCSMVLAMLIPFTRTPIIGEFTILIVTVFVAVLFVVFLAKHEKVRFEQIAIVFMVSFLIPYALSTLVFIRDAEKSLAMYYIILIFASSWISDAGAYFVGRSFGKHKLAPLISPNKTIEGAAGGVIFCVIFNVAFTTVYIEVLKSMGEKVEFNLLLLIVLSVFASITGIFGDLSASIVKRQCSIKDFGKIMPGHGGVIDRFDSLLFVAPLVFIVTQFIKIIELV